MRTKCRSIATFHRPIHSHWSLPLSINVIVIIMKNNSKRHPFLISYCMSYNREHRKQYEPAVKVLTFGWAFGIGNDLRCHLAENSAA
jgi:hypothetical protein